MHLIETGHHQVNADCDSDLRSHGVLGCAEKCFDAQVLLDPLEEQFDLPAAFVNGSDGLCWQIEVICQEDQALSSLGIKEADTSEFFRKRVTLRTDGVMTPTYPLLPCNE